MYKIMDFTIVSGRADTLLLFCSDYQEAVTAAINKIMQHVPFSRDLRLYPALSCIEIEAPDGSRHLEMLRDYDPTEDLIEVEC